MALSFLPRKIQYKQYSMPIIMGFVTEQFGNWMIEFEDYPCELTVKIWTREIYKVCYGKNILYQLRGGNYYEKDFISIISNNGNGSNRTWRDNYV